MVMALTGKHPMMAISTMPAKTPGEAAIREVRIKRIRRGPTPRDFGLDAVVGKKAKHRGFRRHAAEKQQRMPGQIFFAIDLAERNGDPRTHGN